MKINPFTLSGLFYDNSFDRPIQIAGLVSILVSYIATILYRNSCKMKLIKVCRFQNYSYGQRHFEYFMRILDVTKPWFNIIKIAKVFYLCICLYGFFFWFLFEKKKKTTTCFLSAEMILCYILKYIDAYKNSGIFDN